MAAEADIRIVPLLGDVAVGNRVLVEGGDAEEYLPLPAHYIPDRDVYMLRIQGDSMTGEDGILEGDYVIVDPARRAA